jgi:site-specific DNA-cytosine methylase
MRVCSQGKSVEELVRLTNGISVDYNKPMTDKQRLKKGEKWLRKTYSSMVATHDLCPDISKTHWDDLGITERDKYTYMLTYSFPCQDLSNAGLLQGMRKGSGTRSGLLWEIERILLECKERDCLPHVLLMKNVRGVMSDKDSWSSWDSALRKMGYTNYVQILNAKDYGIPQNRERCFMVSVLGEYAYNFPTPFKRKHSLKDFLDEKVDRKYYLSDEHLKNIASWKAQQKPIESMEKRKDCAPTLTARGAGEEHSGMVLVKDKPPTDDGIHTIGNYGSGHHAKNISSTDGVMPTITTGNHGLGQAIAEKEVSNSIRVGGRGSLDRHQWDMVADEKGD